MDRDSSVSIEIWYGLGGPGIESRWGESFRSRPDWPWGPHSLLYNGYRVYIPGVKQSSSSAEVKEKVEPYHYSPSGPLWPVLGQTSFTHLEDER